MTAGLLLRSVRLTGHHTRLSAPLAARHVSTRSSRFPQLFLHSDDSPTTTSSSTAVSYLPDPAPNLSFSPSTIGYLSLRKDDNADEAMRPNRFEPNPDFLELMHSVLSEIVWSDPALQTEAKARNDGYIHLADRRAPPEVNRVPDPSNIIASLLVHEGKLVPTSYEPSRTYRVFSADGFLTLSDGLMDRLVDACYQARQAELDIWKEKRDGESK